MTRRKARRTFLQQSAMAAVGFWVSGSSAKADSKSPNEKLNIGVVGCGGKGFSDTTCCISENIVALCDVDEIRGAAAFNQFPKATKYQDFRKMLESEKLDAVVVSTADHTHAVAGVMAMKMGKHVYCQKPLTRTVHEARVMREVAAAQKVATQMGNQGTALSGLRKGVEIIRAGAIGPVREVHVWTNRPIWPQGAAALLKVKGVSESLSSSGESIHTAAVPKTLNWDLWLGPAKARPYDPIYAPFSWRGWWDFGTGALGDMACHTANMAFMALKLGYPTSVVAESSEINPQTFPTCATIRWEFPARGDMPPVKFVWYEGKKMDGSRNLPAPELSHGRKLSDSGSLLVGDKGTLFSPNDYGAEFVLLPEKEFADYKDPEPTLPRHPEGNNDINQKLEWIRACKGGPAPLSNFEYAGMLTEAMLLGNVAMRVGKKIEWDGPNMKAKNCPEADQFIKPEYRKGWTL